MKKSLALLLLVIVVLVVLRWWNEKGEHVTLLKTIESQTNDDFGPVLCVNSDGSRFASGLNLFGDKLIIWDSNGVPRSRFDKRVHSLVDLESTQQSHVDPIRGIVFSPDWDAFVWYRERGLKDQGLGIWRLGEHERMYPLLTHFTQINSVAVSSQARQIAVYGFNTETNKKELCVHFPEDSGWHDSGTQIVFDDLPEDRGITRMAFSRDGKRLLAVDRRGDILMWDIANKRLMFSLEASVQIPSLGGNDTLMFSPDAKSFVLMESGAIRIRSSMDGSIEKEFLVESSICCGFSLDYKWYVMYGLNGLELHSLGDGRLVHTFSLSDENYNSFIDAAFSGDSRRMVTSSPDGTYRLWDLTDIIGR